MSHDAPDMTLLGVKRGPSLQGVAPSKHFQHGVIVLGVVAGDVANLQVACHMLSTKWGSYKVDYSPCEQSGGGYRSCTTSAQDVVHHVRSSSVRSQAGLPQASTHQVHAPRPNDL